MQHRKQPGADEDSGRAEPLGGVFVFCFLIFRLSNVYVFWQRSEELKTNLGDTNALICLSSPLPQPREEFLTET